MKKRIVVYGVKTFPSQGGTDRVSENIIFQLRHSFDITLYCFKNETSEMRFEGVKIVEFKKRLGGAAGVFIYFLESALYLLVKEKAALVHVHKTEAAFFVPLLRLRFKVISTSHEAPYKRDKWGWLAKLFFRFVEWVFIRSSNVCTSISKPLAEYYEARYGKPVIFIPNGINPVERKNFDGEAMKRFIPAGASIDQPFVLFSARRLMSTKGPQTMLEALSLIDYKGQVFIAAELNEGDPFLARLKTQIGGLNVHFLGFVSPLRALLPLIEKAELFIFPSETEGMSIMLLEVASVGRPIVASDIPENKQVFENDEVLYFKSKDAHDLADKLKFAFQNKSEMAVLGQKCQLRVNQDYRWDQIAKRYASLYDDLVA
jgi:glycosyltransferase involved in cell wall biosynthesis